MKDKEENKMKYNTLRIIRQLLKTSWREWNGR